MRQIEFDEWLEKPQTRAFLELIKEHVLADKEAITNVMLNTGSINNIDLHQISQLRGQIVTLELILDTESFMGELIDEEVHTTGSESNYQD